MSIVLSILSFLLGALAVPLPMLPAFIPRLGLLPLYRMRLLRGIVLSIAWLLAIVTWNATPGALSNLLFGALLFFTLAATTIEPQRVFVALDAPGHLPAEQALISDDVVVLGYEDSGLARAWLFDTLIPRHIVNDSLGDKPLLAGY
ncbi:MAG: hypothetical protein GY759_10375 [Chloroflexi bacterium]|nr:hypothetical protein [Chloroflexota bacterium]